MIKEKVDDFIWICIQQLHFLDSQRTLANTFIKSKLGDKNICSKTVWKNNNPVFNEIVTGNWSSKIVFEVWDRQKK